MKNRIFNLFKKPKKEKGIMNSDFVKGITFNESPFDEPDEEPDAITIYDLNGNEVS